ncbi:MAG: hypothetical protein PWQ06_1109 [Anaerophaga sp.]|nr:hypothetical protein [Anaerophaga sp.]
MSINAVHQWFFRVDQLFKLVKLFRLYSVFYIGKGVKQLDFKHSQLERQKARVFPQLKRHHQDSRDIRRKVISLQTMSRGGTND